MPVSELRSLDSAGFSELRIKGIIHELTCPHGIGDYWLNPGMTRIWGKTVFMYRLNRWPSQLYLAELGSNYQLLDPRPVLLATDSYAAEDTRLLPVDDKLLVFYSGVDLEMPPLGGMHMATLNAALEVASQTQLESSEPIEKNWVPFYYDDQLCCIYSHSPFTVLACQDNGANDVIYQGEDLLWEFGEIRGGAPPVWHNDRWYHFFHSSVRMNNSHGQPVRVYYVGCYTFDRDFNFLAITDTPIMSGSVAAGTKPWLKDGLISAIFPCGAIVDGDHWLLSYGYLDADARIASIPLAALEERLTPFIGCVNKPSPIG